MSLFEKEQQDAKKPDPPRQYNLQLDSKLTITTERRHLSSKPTDEKGLRLKYSIMTNLWLLAQMRQPGRSIYADFDRNTFIDFLETLLDKDNFNFYKEVDGRPMISLSWSYCLSYELELRKEAIRLCKKQSFGIQSALWTALRNTEHRMKHWLQLVAIPNAPSSSSNQELQSLKKRIADLEKVRSRSPRRNTQKQLAVASGPQMLALPAPSAPAQGQKVGKRGNKKRGLAGLVTGNLLRLRGGGRPGLELIPHPRLGLQYGTVSGDSLLTTAQKSCLSLSQWGKSKLLRFHLTRSCNSNKPSSMQLIELAFGFSARVETEWMFQLTIRPRGWSW